MTKESMTLDVDPSILERNMRIVEENPIEQEMNKLFSSVDMMPYKSVQPRPGFCVKTYSRPDNKKVFVNICLCEYVPRPPKITNEELLQILSSDDPAGFKVPMSIGEARVEQDKSGAPATVYDVAIHPDIIDQIETDDVFQTFFLTVVLEGIQDKYQIELDTSRSFRLKNRKSVGTIRSQNIQIRDIQQCEEIIKPLIEELKKSPPKIAEKPPVKMEENPQPEIVEESIPTVQKQAETTIELIYRVRREPPTGEIEYLLAEFLIPPTVSAKDLSLEIGEDRFVLDSKGLFNLVDFYLPCSIDQDIIDARLDRNVDMLLVKMPIIH